MCRIYEKLAVPPAMRPGGGGGRRGMGEEEEGGGGGGGDWHENLDQNGKAQNNIHCTLHRTGLASL